MKGSTGGKWILSALSVVLLVFAVGCAKKELVKSTDTASGAAVSTLPPVETKGGLQEPIVTETTQTAMAGVAATQEKPSDFPDIHFDYDKSFLREDAKLILQEVAAYLKANRAALILIEGHCDERGTAEYNIALGERRAESARSYLVSFGVKASAVSTVSFGEEKPIDPGHDEVAWERNRRGHFVRK